LPIYLLKKKLLRLRQRSCHSQKSIFKLVTTEHFNPSRKRTAHWIKHPSWKINFLLRKFCKSIQ